MTRLLGKVGADGALRLLSRAGSLVASSCFESCCGPLTCPCFFRIRLCEGQSPPSSCGPLDTSRLILVSCAAQCSDGTQILPDDVPDDEDAIYRLIKIGGLCYEVTQQRYYSPDCAQPGQRTNTPEDNALILSTNGPIDDSECFAVGTTCLDGDCPQAVGYIWGQRCPGSTGPNDRVPYVCFDELDQCKTVRLSTASPAGLLQDCYILDPASQQFANPPPNGVNAFDTSGVTIRNNGDCCDCLDTICDKETAFIADCNTQNVDEIECCCDGVFEWRVVGYNFSYFNRNESGIITEQRFAPCAVDDGGFPCQGEWCIVEKRTFPDGSTESLTTCALGLYPGENSYPGCTPPFAQGFVTPFVSGQEGDYNLNDCGFQMVSPTESLEFSVLGSGNCQQFTQTTYARRINRVSDPELVDFVRTIRETIVYRRVRLSQSVNCSGGCPGGDPGNIGPTPFTPIGPSTVLSAQGVTL